MEFSLSFFQEETTQRTIQTSLCPSQTYQNQFYIYCDHPRSWNMIISLPRHHHFGIGGPRLSTLMALGHLGRMGGRVNLGHCFGCSMYKIVDDLWIQPGISKSNNVIPHQSFFHIFPTWTRSIKRFQMRSITPQNYDTQAKHHRDACLLLCWATWTAVMGHGPSTQNWHWVCEK
jgi:hypothetical protein